MRTLPTEFRKSGFDYGQVQRQGNVAIYRQTKPGVRGVWFEVGKIRQNEARTIAGNQIEAGESWPRSEDWGVLAYTYSDLSHAQQRAAAMVRGKTDFGVAGY